MLSKILKLAPMIVIFAFLISGCGSSGEVSNETTPPTESYHLNISETDIIEHMDERLGKHGYTTLDAGLQSVLTKEVNGENYRCNLFLPSNGMYFYFLTKESTGELYQFTYKTVQAEISASANMMNGYIANTLPYIFEPDTWEALIEELQLDAADDVTTAFAEREDKGYHYSKSDAASYFHLIPLKGEVIDIDQLDFENGEIRPQQIDWHESDFVDKLNSYFEKQSFPPLSDPTPMSDEELEGLPKDIIKGVYYSLGSGVRLYLYSSDSGRLERAEYIVLLNNVTNNSLSNFGYAFTITVQMLDNAKADAILDELDMANLASKTSRSAIGGQMDYFYSVDKDGIIAFFSRISPLVSLDSAAK